MKDDLVLRVTGWSKFAEEDVFAQGCIPGTSSMADGRDTWETSDIECLIDKLMQFVGCGNPENVERDTMDEIGRIDIHVMEDEDGTAATPGEIELWRAGKKRLWDVTYTFYVEVVKPYSARRVS